MLHALVAALAAIAPQDPSILASVVVAEPRRARPFDVDGSAVVDVGFPWTFQVGHLLERTDAPDPTAIRHPVRPAMVEWRHDFGEAATRELADGVHYDLDRWSDSFAVHGESQLQWAPWLRSSLGLRGDSAFDLDSLAVSERGDDGGLRIDASLVAAPWSAFECFANFEADLHSNDPFGTPGDDPTAPTPSRAAPGSPLARSRGAALGLRCSAFEGMQTTISLWGRDDDNEVVFADDADETEAILASRRYGIEVSNHWRPLPWLLCDGGLGLARARFAADDAAGDDPPAAGPATFAAGLSANWTEALSTSLRVFHLGAQPNGEGRLGSTTRVNARLQWRFGSHSEFTLEGLNLLGSRDEDVEYYYGSPEASDDDPHFHAVEPLTLQLSFATRF